MQILKLLFGAAALVSLSVEPAFAGPNGPLASHGHASAPPPHATPTSSTQTHGSPHSAPATTHTVPETTHGTPHTSPTTPHGNPHATAPTTSATSSSGATTPSTNTTGSPTASSTGSTTTTPLNPIAQKISSKPQLSARLQHMLPMGVTLDQASAGFKNQGQFIAALHVSQNLGIPFANLKAAMMGTPPPTARGTTGTGTPSTSLTSSPKSLGQAIHQLRPSDDSTTAAQAAEHEAEQDLTTTSSSTGTSSTSTAGATTGKKNSR